MTRWMMLVLLGAAPAAIAAEGKWTPAQVLQLDRKWLAREGLRVPAQKLWDARRGGGLLSNAVKLGGCSGAFVSEEGLVITNHHCVVGILQENSTPKQNLFEEGFLAASRKDERASKAVRMQVPRRFTDVTQEVLSAIPAGADDLQRIQAIERKQKELVAACERKPATRCHFAAFDGGLFYTLTESFEIADVRLVYAPPRAIGEFGGEVDNWMWPRHSGDFAIVRAYVSPEGLSATYDPGNVPYRPEHFFPISKEGVKAGDFVAVLGYPGLTYRSLLADEMVERRELYFPRIRQLLDEWIDLAEEATRGKPEGQIALADTLKSYANRRKNAEGQLAGLARGRTVERQREREEAVAAWAGKHQEHRGAVAARAELRALAAEKKKTWERDFLLDTLSYGSRALSFSTTLARISTERQKPDAEREPDYMDRELPRLRERLERDQKRLFVPADQKLFASWVRRALALPADQRIAAVDAAFGGAKGDELSARIAGMYASSRVLDLAERSKMFDERPDALHARKDPLLELGFQLDQERKVLKDRRDRWAGAVSRLRPVWQRAAIAHAGRPVAPDANGTLRVTFGRVQGYSPRDGVLHTPQTTLTGLLAKHTGEPPFDVPDQVAAVARSGARGPWVDSKLKDVPVCFLADADTTGGNSGSPTINGRGELVGVNFDRVWENVANDFGYDPEVARNVNADVRYLLWLLDQVENADGLLRELKIRPPAASAR